MKKKRKTSEERIEKIKTLKENVLMILERFPFYKYAANINGITDDTLKNMRDEDKEFSDNCKASRGRGMMKYANKASPEFMLKAADPKTFRERKEVDITSGGKPIMGGTAHVSTDNGIQEASSA